MYVFELRTTKIPGYFPGHIIFQDFPGQTEFQDISRTWHFPGYFPRRGNPAAHVDTRASSICNIPLLLLFLIIFVCVSPSSMSGAPQASILYPILFILYTPNTTDIASWFGLIHIPANDTRFHLKLSVRDKKQVNNTITKDPSGAEDAIRKISSDYLKINWPV